jgi:hypothetical protein
MKSKLTPLFFPFSRTFRKMGLSRHWWHRLAIVLYASLLIVCAAVVWALRSESPYRASWAEPERVGHENADAIGHRIGHPVYDAADKVVFFDSDGNLRLVQYNLVSEAVESGGHRAVPMVSPDSKWVGYLPENRVSDATKAGGRSLNIPQGFVLESTTADNEIPYWYLRRHPKWWQVLLELYGVVLVVTLGFSYLLQGVYRAFVYIVRGSPPAAAHT